MTGLFYGLYFTLPAAAVFAAGCVALRGEESTVAILFLSLVFLPILTGIRTFTK
jgi:hypothetical protein